MQCFRDVCLSNIYLSSNSLTEIFTFFQSLPRSCVYKLTTRKEKFDEKSFGIHCFKFANLLRITRVTL